MVAGAPTAGAGIGGVDAAPVAAAVVATGLASARGLSNTRAGRLWGVRRETKGTPSSGWVVPSID
jgi:hypothetical protein